MSSNHSSTGPGDYRGPPQDLGVVTNLGDTTPLRGESATNGELARSFLTVEELEYRSRSSERREDVDLSEDEKVVAAICIAPSILVNAGILNGRRATAFPSERDNINAVGTFTGKPVEVDGKIITANGPEAAAEFGKKIADAIK